MLTSSPLSLSSPLPHSVSCLFMHILIVIIDRAGRGRRLKAKETSLHLDGAIVLMLLVNSLYSLVVKVCLFFSALPRHFYLTSFLLFSSFLFFMKQLLVGG